MNSKHNLRTLLICATTAVGLMWFASGGASQSIKPSQNKTTAHTSEDYVGSDVCEACHEDQFKAYAHTAHAELGKLASWNNKVTGCESCHGPGKAHVEADGDVTKIISFKNKSPKETSETCLSCHAGKEERNNFRRGEHWRNDVGCTDCHSPHGFVTGPNVASSNLRVTTANAEKPGFSTIRMLKQNDPQICLSCHSEVKPQFSMPFHHKVLEGAMRCSDCHNPHGGFELKQTRLATGADAACLKCHADKQGPFLYEHAPVKTEGCSACHTPHGSANPRLLRFSAVDQLCLTCHSLAHDVGAVEPAGPQHNQNAQYANCTACHLKIHGSRSSPVFFR
ncbi:MAG TPA: DmsE family decaheme c-type cytochrome [Pyrinomonadaceae bacterium]|nr:DmsE family decaheme c-type cytochrome [Pyrinomonadaceae bacterium]